MSNEIEEGADGANGAEDIGAEASAPVTIRSLLAKGRLKRVTIDDQIQVQEDLYGFALEEGETALRFRDIAKMEKAIELLSGRMLIKEARVHANLYRRILTDPLGDYNAARQQVENSITPEEIAASAVTPQAKVVAYERTVQELGMLVTGVKLPKPFTEKMMPVRSEKHPNNEAGLAAIQQALGLAWEGNIEKKKEGE